MVMIRCACRAFCGLAAPRWAGARPDHSIKRHSTVEPCTPLLSAPRLAATTGQLLAGSPPHSAGGRLTSSAQTCATATCRVGRQRQRSRKQIQVALPTARDQPPAGVSIARTPSSRRLGAHPRPTANRCLFAPQIGGLSAIRRPLDTDVVRHGAIPGEVPGKCQNQCGSHEPIRTTVYSAPREKRCEAREGQTRRPSSGDSWEIRQNGSVRQPSTRPRLTTAPQSRTTARRTARQRAYKTPVM
jgi:hypothetical protein